MASAMTSHLAHQTTHSVIPNAVRDLHLNFEFRSPLPSGGHDFQSCRKAPDATHSVIPNAVRDLLFLRRDERGVRRFSTAFEVAPNQPTNRAAASISPSACGRSTAAPYLPQPPAKTRRGARRAVPLFHFRPSTVDCRLAHAYRASGFSGLNTPCGLSFQIHACTSHGVLAKKWPPFALQSASLRPCGFSRPASMQTLPC